MASRPRPSKAARAAAKAARDVFYRSTRSGDLATAWSTYKESEARDGYMLSALLKLVSRLQPEQRAQRLATLWASVDLPNDRANHSTSQVTLDSHLSSDFISGYGSQGNLRMARRVLETARDAGLANTRVYNSYLRACERTPDKDFPLAVDEAAKMVARMEGADKSVAPVDAFTLALASRVLGRAGRLHEAAELVERARDVADTVSHNALIWAAAKAGDVNLALSTLQTMEESGPPPDEVSYTSSLHALVVRAADVSSEAAGTSPSMDLPAAALELRERMAARGIDESDATRTSLLALFSDTPLGEAVLAEGPAVPFNAEAPRHQNGAKMGALLRHATPAVVTDLRGLTRQAVAIMLRQELQRASERSELGVEWAAGEGGADSGGWAVLVSTLDGQGGRGGGRGGGGAGGRSGGRSGGHDGGGTGQRAGGGGGGERGGVTLRTALDFFDAEGIACTQRRGLLFVEHAEFERAAEEAASHTRRQRMRQGISLWSAIILSGLAAMSVVPRLRASTGL